MSDAKTSPAKPTRPKDQVFREPQRVTDFDFGEKVASVFDDMLDRSVPFYHEIQRMIADMATDFATEGSNVYDLGCSTGNTLLNLDAVAGESVTLIGVDYSEEMLKRCRDKLAASGFKHKHELICADLNQGIRIDNASMVVMVLRNPAPRKAQCGHPWPPARPIVHRTIGSSASPFKRRRVSTPSPSFGRRGPPDLRRGGLATGSGEKSGLARILTV